MCRLLLRRALTSETRHSESWEDFALALSDQTGLNTKELQSLMTSAEHDQMVRIYIISLYFLLFGVFSTNILSALSDPFRLMIMLDALLV